MINSISSTDMMSQMMMMQKMQPPEDGGRPPKPPEFSDIDTDSSGGIDKTEFADSLSNAPFAEQISGHEEELFNILDTNSDGILSESEFKDGHKAMQQFMEEELGITPPPMKMAEQPNSENALVNQAIASYEKSSDMTSSLASSLIDIIE